MPTKDIGLQAWLSGLATNGKDEEHGLKLAETEPSGNRNGVPVFPSQSPVGALHSTER